MATVLRVQNAQGEGPYQTLFCDLSFFDAHCIDKDRRPGPYCDMGIRRVPSFDEYCAFKDAEQLAAWFEPEEILEMCSHGFSIHTIDNVDLTGVGEKQVLFRRPKKHWDRDTQKLLAFKPGNMVSYTIVQDEKTFISGVTHHVA